MCKSSKSKLSKEIIPPFFAKIQTNKLPEFAKIQTNKLRGYDRGGLFQTQVL